MGRDTRLDKQHINITTHGTNAIITYYKFKNTNAPLPQPKHANSPTKQVSIDSRFPKYTAGKQTQTQTSGCAPSATT